MTEKWGIDQENMRTKKTPLQAGCSNISNIEMGEPMNDVGWCEDGEIETLFTSSTAQGGGGSFRIGNL